MDETPQKMKKYTATLSLLGLFLALGAYVYFVEIKGSEKKQVQKEKEKKVFVFDRDNVDTLTLILPDKTIKFQRYGEKQWRFLEPITDEADIFAVNNLVSTLSTLEKQRTFEGEDFKKGEFKLEKPEMEIHFRITGEEGDRVLKFGRNTPSGSTLYVQVGEEAKAYLVDAGLKRDASKPVESFRNKVVLDFTPKDVKEVLIEVSQPQETIHLLKENAQWSVKEPVQVEANEKNITTYLEDVSYLRADALLDKLDISKPYLKITLNDDKVLSFYKKVDSKKAYVARQGRHVFMEVEAQEVEKNFIKKSSYFKEEPPPPAKEEEKNKPAESSKIKIP